MKSNCFLSSLLFFLFIITINGGSFVNCACTYKQFKCFTANVCINTNLVCDGSRDCPDGSDENLCSVRYSRAYRRSLKNRSFVKSLEIQPKINKFTRMAEEIKKCPPHLRTCPKIGCAPDFVSCEVHRNCDWINETFNCRKKCSPDEFRCSAYYCITKDKVCNGKFNCFNRMDEFNCPNLTLTITKENRKLSKRYKDFYEINTIEKDPSTTPS